MPAGTNVAPRVAALLCALAGLLVATGYSSPARADIRYIGDEAKPKRRPARDPAPVATPAGAAVALPHAGSSAPGVRFPARDPVPARDPARAPAPAPAPVTATAPLSADNMATAPKPAGFAYSLIANAIIDELSDTYLYVRASKDAPTTKAIPVPRDRALLAQCISGGTVDDLVRNTVITVKFDPTGVVRPEILIQSKPQKEQLAGATVSARAGSKLFVTTASGESRVFQIEGGEAAWKEAVVGGDAAQLVFGAKVDIDYDPSGREGIQIRVVSPPAPAKAKGCSASAGPQGWSGLAGLGLVLGAVWRTRRRRHGVLLAALPLLVVAAAGCSDTTTGDGNNLADATNDVGGSPFDTKLQDGQDAMADIPQQTSCEFPFEPAKGQPGAACSENKDCDNGLCVDGPSGKICTTICTTCCPTGFFCGQNQIASGDFAYVCLPRLGALCRPCTTTTECEDANPGSRCLDYGAQGKFCGATCSTTDDCPAGYSCVPDGDAKQCKLDSGECSCSQKAIDSAASTSCSVTNSYGSCPGTRQCTAAGLQACSGATPAPESCNGKDDDCDGETDEGTTGLDTDKDGTDDCVDADDDGDGTPDDQDCAPLDKTIGPKADETCDDKDNDCDGQTDEEGAAGCTKWYQDADKDSFGSPIAQCLCAPTGDLTAKSASDCDDGNADANPSKPEVCGNSLDDDCDGSTDEWDGTVNCQNFYADGDNDGWGSGAPACRCGPSQAHPASKSGDCDDSASNISPSTAESCNGKDDNCDGVTDEEDAVGCTQWYVDGDKDGYGNAALSACLCKPNSAFPAAAGGDCNDNAKSVSPGANEACGGGDEDCDGATDETGADGCTNWYPDADSDGYGGASGQCRCSSGGGYTATTNTDCNDASNSAYPGATELCNGVDDDCDNMADDGFGLGLGCGAGQGSCIATGKIVCAADGKSSYCSANATAGSPESCNNADDDCDGQTDEGCDDDGDGWCDSALGYQASAACPKGPGDCNDTSDQQNPGASELCNGKDDDCNGQTDGQTQACSNGYTSGTETCVAGSWQNCNAPEPECTSGPCCDNGKFRPATYQCGTTAYSTTQDCSGSCGGGITQTEQWQYCTGSSATCGTSNLKTVQMGVVSECGADSLCKDNGTTATCQACANGCAAGACQTQPKVTVCIDPGYGGTETGAVTSEGIKSKDINLSMALFLKEWLDKDSADPTGGGNWKVVMTRSSDVTVTDAQRAAICNNANATRVLGVNANDNTSTSVNGVEGYIATDLGLNSNSEKLCTKVVEELVAATGLAKPKFVKTGTYAILKQTSAPACLGLPGYINNPIDKPKLLSESVRKAIGLGYLKALQRDQGLSAYQPK